MSGVKVFGGPARTTRLREKQNNIMGVLSLLFSGTVEQCLKASLANP